MGFPQEMGTQDDKMKANFCFDTLSKHAFKRIMIICANLRFKNDKE